MTTFYKKAEIVPGVWVGSVRDALDAEFVRHHRIGLIVNCTNDIACPLAVEYHVVGIDDSSSQSGALLAKLPGASRKIHETLSKRMGVLIHCFAGLQRSCAVAAGFLMDSRGMTAEEAMQHLRRHKPGAFLPKATFQYALDVYGFK